jgi:hypothetical protein
MAFKLNKGRVAYKAARINGCVLKVAYSDHIPSFEYRPGKMVYPDAFDRTPYICSEGIHFFLRRKDAASYL